MSWQAQTTEEKPVFDGGRQRVQVVIFDGTRKFFQIFFAVDADDLRRQVLRTTAQLDVVQSSAKPIQPNTAIDLTPDPPVVTPPFVPTPAQAWQTVRGQYRRRRELLTDGVIAADDKTLADLAALMIATFVDTPDYTGGP